VLWVTRLRAGALPGRGELVTASNPESGEKLVRRVVALGGDYVRPLGETSGSRLVVVPTGFVWLECDRESKRDGSMCEDSNDFGPVSASLSTGCVRYAAGAGEQSGLIKPRAESGGRVISPTGRYV
jgi:hypothetical protein